MKTKLFPVFKTSPGNTAGLMERTTINRDILGLKYETYGIQYAA